MKLHYCVSYGITLGGVMEPPLLCKLWDYVGGVMEPLSIV